MKRVAIVQSNYIPWKGYFDLIAAVDEFIVFDDVQYTRRDWRNRNKIKTPAGTRWLSVPVKVRGRYHQTIRETEIDGDAWAKKHWRSLAQNYRRARHYEQIAAHLEDIYRSCGFAFLSELNCALIETVCSLLGIDTHIAHSRDYELRDGRSERLAHLCEQAGADCYVSGPTAKSYLDESVFHDRGIAVHWFEYHGYEPYPQLWGAFVHEVTVLDLLFNCGDDAPKYMKFGTR